MEKFIKSYQYVINWSIESMSVKKKVVGCHPILTPLNIVTEKLK